MKYLSKITFINSAHIRFGEVELDGNVHFTGTQGVGKSTLLRAILFFYNADKMHLGIRQQGQRPFDDFYLPNPTSYIVYEVNRGEGETPFSIIVFKHRGRAVYRFVDAPFSPHWIIDEAGQVSADPLVVRERIRKSGADASMIIDTYEQYRDIIYGNSHANLTRDLRKYAILESTQYRNIPRIIQNVFLNERVDADFIKDTIIRSMGGDDETTIDLRYFRSQLADFSNEYNDIVLWTKKDRHGENEVRKRAHAVTESAHAIKAKTLATREDCGRLNFAMHDAERNIPVTRKKAGDQKAARQAIADRMTEAEANYNDHRDKLVGDIRHLDISLRESHKLQKQYRQMGIDDMLALASKEPALRAEHTNTLKQIAILEQQYADIANKYKALIDQLNADNNQYRQVQRDILQQAREQYSAAARRRFDERQHQHNELEASLRDQYADIEQRTAQLKDELHDTLLRQHDALTKEFFADEMAECKALLEKLTLEKLSLEADNATRKQQVERLRAEAAARELEIRNATAGDVAAIKAEQQSINEKIEAEQQLIDNAKGSFGEWLDANVEGWTDTIGRVIDERHVLYHTALSPRKAADYDGKAENGATNASRGNLFGVEIDLEELACQVRTPQQIMQSLEQLKQQLADCAHRLAAIETHTDDEVKASNQKFANKVKALNEATRDADTRLFNIPQERKRLELQLDDLEKRQQKERQNIYDTLETKKGELQIALYSLGDERKKLDETRDKQQKAIDQKYNTEERAAQKELKQTEQTTTEAIARHDAETRRQTEEIEAQKANALQAEGADVAMLAACRKKIADTEAQLNTIKEQSATIAKYRYDCERLFEHEPEMTEKKAKQEAELADMERKYSERREKLAAQKAQLTAQIADLEQKATQMETGLAAAHDFMQTEACPDYLADMPEMHTADTCQTIVQRIMQLVAETSKAELQLKESTNAFSAMFSQRNTFKFPTTLNTSADYMAYAESVDDFVTNNKIEQFQQVTSNAYINILGRISREFGDLTEREAEIQKVVREVNYDFTQKTFAGVIRGIELRLERSRQPIVALFEAIRDFWIERQNDLGEANLFSTGDNAEANREAVKCLERLTSELNQASDADTLSLTDTFTLKLKIDENDNSTGWIDNIRMVGSDGTDILVKAIINILLINVFKQRVGKRSADFRIHCMMDEIGKLADENIQGILDFANERGIFVVNSSPKTHRPLSYRHLYILSKGADANTVVQPILTSRQKALL